MSSQEVSKQTKALTAEESAWIEVERSKYAPTCGSEDIAFAYARLATIFRRPITDISAEQEFGRDLQASFNSFFRRNEIDQVRLDLEDVAVDLSPELKVDYDAAITVFGYVTVMCEAALLARMHLRRELAKSLRRLR
jgi:hypothetical protein